MQEHVEVRGNRIHITKQSFCDQRAQARRGCARRRSFVGARPHPRRLRRRPACLRWKNPRLRFAATPRPAPHHRRRNRAPRSNRPTPAKFAIATPALISALCREQGVDVITHVHAGDDWGKLLYVMSKAKPKTYDMILISGGSGGGDYDFSAGLFKELNATIHFREVNVRPGKPLIFGTAEGKNRSNGSDRSDRSDGEEDRREGPRRLPEAELILRQAQDDGLLGARIIFGLPGNALSHFVCFQLFVRRALDRMLGRSPNGPVSAFLNVGMRETNNARETWWPAQAGMREGRLVCRALPWKSSGDITRLPAANALIQVPASTSHFPAGTMVNLLLTQNPRFHAD